MRCVLTEEDVRIYRHNAVIIEYKSPKIFIDNFVVTNTFKYLTFNDKILQ